MPDETTVCKFRRLLEENNLGEEILGTVNLHLQAKHVRITTDTIVDATLIHAPSSTKKLRARVEHVLPVMKLKFGFVKERYRGLKERAPTVRYLCAGESFCGPQKTARCSVGSSGFAL